MMDLINSSNTDKFFVTAPSPNTRKHENIIYLFDVLKLNAGGRENSSKCFGLLKGHQQIGMKTWALLIA